MSDKKISELTATATLAESDVFPVVNSSTTKKITLANLRSQVSSTWLTDLLPATDDTYDIGSALKRWQDLFLSGTATVTGAVVSKTDTLVKPFIVVGTSGAVDYLCDGTADDVQIQAAMDAAGAGTVFIKKGTYNYSTDLIVKQKYLKIKGEAMGGTILNYSGTGSAIKKSGATGVGLADYLTVEDIEIKGANTTTDIGLNLSEISWASIKNIYIYQSGIGIKLYGVCYFNTIIHPSIWGSKYGIHVDGNANENKFYGGGVESIQTAGNGIYCNTGDNNIFDGVSVESNTVTLIYLGPSSYQNKVMHCRMEGTGLGILIDTATAGSHNTLFDNYYASTLSACISDLGTSTYIWETTGTTATFGASNQVSKEFYIKQVNPRILFQDNAAVQLGAITISSGMYLQSSANGQTAQGFHFYTAGAGILSVSSTGLVSAKQELITQTATTGEALHVTRDLAAASTDSPLAYFQNVNAGDDQVAVNIFQAGTNYALYVQQNGIPVAGASALAVYSNADIDDATSRLVMLTMNNILSASDVLYIQNNGTGASLSINADGATGGAIRANLGAFTIENTGNTGTAFNIYSNTDATSASPLMTVTADNALFDQDLVALQQDGVGKIMYLQQDGVPTGSIFEIYTNADFDASNSGIIELTMDNANSSSNCILTQNDGTGNGLFIDQNGNGIALNIDSEATSAVIIQITNAGSGADISAPNFTLTNGALVATTINTLIVGLGTNSIAGNTAIGVTALQGANSGNGGNTAIGYRSLYANTSGAYNTAIGNDSMKEVTTGSSNTAVGFQTLGTGAAQAVTGSYNVAIGMQTLLALISGTNNTAVGYQALSGVQSGTNNTGIGAQTLTNLNSADSGCVALGYYAGHYETDSNAFYVDNQNRTDTAGDKAGALLYGVFNATPASQTLKVNATLTATALVGPLTGNVTGNCSGSAGTVTGLTFASGKTLTINNILTLAGTDSTVMTFPATSDTVAALGTQQTFTKGQSITIAATTNQVGLTVTQNDTTNNPVGISIVNATTSASFLVDANGATGGAIRGNLGAVAIENTGNTGTAFNIYSNLGATSSSPLMIITADNALFDQNLIVLQNDGVARCMYLQQDGIPTASILEIYTNADMDTAGVSILELIMDNAASSADAIIAQHDGTGRSIFADQNGNGTALDIDTEATSADSINLDAVNTSGVVVDINLTPTKNQSVNTGMMTLDYALTVDDAGTYTKQGTILSITNSQTQTSGTITDTAICLSVTQNSDTSNAVNVTNASTGEAVYINQTGILAAGLYALDVYSNADQDNANVYLVGMTQDNAGSSRGVLKTLNDGTGVNHLVWNTGVAIGIFIDEDANGLALSIDKDCTVNDTRTWAMAVASDNAGTGTALGCGIDMSSFSVDEPILKTVADAITGGSLVGQFAIDIAGTTRYVPYFTDGTGSITTTTLTFIIDGGGSAITTGQKGHLEIPFACTINQVTLLADTSGSIVIDVWKDTYANFPPTDADSITASAVPTITTATKSQDATLTGWTTAVVAGDILAFNVDSCTTITRCTVSLRVLK